MTAPWNEEEDKQLAQVLKKAKRKSMVRSIIISLAVVLVTLTAIFFGAAQMVNHRSSETLMSEWRYRMIASPNEYESGYKDTRGFLSGVLKPTPIKLSKVFLFPGSKNGLTTMNGGFHLLQAHMAVHRL